MKWFWLSFFGFLTFLVVSAAMVRPDTVDAMLTYVGTYLAVVGWAIVGGFVLLVFVGIALAVAFVWAFVHNKKVEARRQRDGSYPLQQLDPRKPSVWYDPNQQVGSAAAWHPQAGWIEFDGGAGWDNQRHISSMRALVSRVQAMAPGDRAIERVAHEMRDSMGGGGVLSRMRAADMRLAEKPPKEWRDEPRPVAQLTGPTAQSAPTYGPPPAPVLPPMTLSETVGRSSRERIVFGRSSAGELATWDVTETPHCRLHGSTQRGKTSAAITIVAAALANSHQVVILDPRGFKNWRIAADYAELVDVRDPTAFADALRQVHDEYLRRDALLAQYGAKDVAALPNANVHRVFVVIEEYGAQRARAQMVGTLEQVDNYMRVLASEAAASGVHLLAIDSRPTQYHPFVKANLGAVVVFGLPDEGSGKAAGYARAHKLGRYEFAYDGVVYQSVNAAPDFDAVVRGRGSVYHRPVMGRPVTIDGERSQGVREAVHEPVHGAFTGHSPEVDVSETAMNDAVNESVNTPMNDAPTTVDGWYEWTLENYLPTHPELLQVDIKTRGAIDGSIRPLAEAMAQASRGSAAEFKVMKGTASEVAKRIRGGCSFIGGDGTVVGIDEKIPPKKEQ